MTDSNFIELLQKIMAIHAWDEQQRPSSQQRLVDLLLAEVQSTTGFQSLEDALQEESLPDKLPEGVEGKLYDRLKKSAPLREYLSTPPLLSAIDPKMLQIAVRLADVAPNRQQTMMDSRDALFLRIMERWRHEPVTAGKLLEEDANKVSQLLHYAPTAGEPLLALAAQESWQSLMEQVERSLENGAAEGTRPPEVQALVAAIDAVEDAATKKGAVDLLLSPPRFSAISPLVASTFSRPVEGLDPDLDLLPALQQARPEETIVMLREYQYRLDAAGHFLSLRKFAKLDALDHKWPDLYRRFNVDRTAVVQFEQYLNEPEATRDNIASQPAAVQKLMRDFGADEDLVRFLHLRPLLDEIYEDERKRHQQIQTTTPTRFHPEEEKPEIKSVEAPEEKLEVKGVDTSTVRSAASSGQALEGGPPEVHLHFQQVEGAEEAYEAALEGVGDLPVTGPLTVDWAALEEEETKLLVRADPNESVERRFRQLGRFMYLQFFDVKFQRELWKALQQGTASQPQRVLFQMDDPRLHQIPWESLFVSPIDRLIFASSHFSTLRYVPGEVEPPPVFPESGPLRVLVLLQSPVDWPTYDFSYEQGLVMRMMDDPSRFEVKELYNAKLADAEVELRGMSPQVVHLVMPSFADQSNLSEWAPSPHLPFLDEQGNSVFLPVSDLAFSLQAGGVKLVTLTTAGTATRPMIVDEWMIATAVGLAEAGIPSVVAPTRTGSTSLPFHRAFYGALAAGQTVEAAVLAGRRALKTENQPWIRYGLFAGVKEPLKIII